MKKYFLDTNILIYFFDTISIHHTKVVTFLENCEKNDITLFISNTTIQEFTHVFLNLLFIYKYSDPYTHLEKTLERIFQLPNIEIIQTSISRDHILKVIKHMKNYKIGVHDASILVTLQKNYIKDFATYDKNLMKACTKECINVLKID